MAALAQDEFSTIPFAAAEALGDLGERAPVEPLLLALGNTSGDEEYNLCLAAAAILFKTRPEVFLRIAPEAVLRGQPAGKILGSHAQEFTERMVGTWKRASLPLLEKLTELLDWHYWQVCLRAAWALGEIRRNIPDAAIRRLSTHCFSAMFHLIKNITELYLSIALFILNLFFYREVSSGCEAMTCWQG